MKNIIKKIQNKAGYISIETIIVGGLIISLGIFVISTFWGDGREIVFASADKVITAIDVQADVTPII
ncbi:MAG: hypothetical protein K0R54_5 [Clostridiaceae bacterium]|jgi:hypothetical protein|nr:hypothetical protein [Clostridiaceae bacterium]